MSMRIFTRVYMYIYIYVGVYIYNTTTYTHTTFVHLYKSLIMNIFTSPQRARLK